MERSALFAQKPRRRINNQRVDASMSRRSALVAQSAREQRSSKDYSGKLTDSSEHVYEGTTESTATGKEFANDEFQESCLVLCTKDNQSIQRSISVAAPLASRMKSHQVEGIRFLWEKVCGDLALATRYEEAKEEKEVGGAILAHFMGLGKTAGSSQSHCLFLFAFRIISHDNRLTHLFPFSRNFITPLAVEPSFS